MLAGLYLFLGFFFAFVVGFIIGDILDGMEG